MAQITINESSANYSYQVGNNSFCTVALPITASWGPAFEDPDTLGMSLDEVLENSAFGHFTATQDGLASFISTYRGAATNYRSAGDYSYQVALTLLTAGYDVEVCRLCPGSHAQNQFKTSDDKILSVRAKYAGSFGNCLTVSLAKVKNKPCWNLIVYVVDSSGAKKAVENLVFAFNQDDSTDSIPYIDELSSSFVELTASGITSEDIEFTASAVALSGGSDRAADKTADEMIEDAIALATARFDMIAASDKTDYIAALTALKGTDVSTASKVKYMEWVYRYTMSALGILTDKLAYNCNRIILPGWDDQNISALDGTDYTVLSAISPLHAKLMETAYYSRCATAYIDIPKCIPRSAVYNDGSPEGYAQILSKYTVDSISDNLFSTHSALFGPWGQFTYSGTSKQGPASPSFLALMIQRAMILNQSLQYEWAMPTTRKHNLSIGKLDYSVPKKLLDEWQSTEGVSLNIIADIPDLGVNVWGNSTLMNVPVATYNALQNLSTRLLVNAIENVAYKCGLSITFQYNNSEAYSKFYAGVTPILDTMRNVGAIEKYTIEMSADIDSLDSVNLNSVLGQISIWVRGVINDITIDLVALPAESE